MHNLDTYRTAIADSRRALARRDYARSLNSLRQAAGVSGRLSREAEQAEASYFYMLRYLASDNSTVELRPAISELEKTVLRLCRMAELAIMEQSSQTALAAQLRYQSLRPEETISSLVSDYLAEHGHIVNDASALTDTRRRRHLEQLSADIFKRLWATYPMSADETDLLKSLFTDPELPLYDRILWVNALGLNYYTYPSEIVSNLLLEVMRKCENRLSATAAAWLVIGLGMAHRLTGRLDDALTLTEEMEHIHADDISDTLTEWCRSLGTEKVSKDFKDTLANSLGKLGRQFRDRLEHLDADQYESLMEGNMPDGLSADIDPSAFDALKKMTEEQRAGADVFMSTLGRMRQFDFFNNIANWFLPFHADHSALADVADDGGAGVADTIGRMDAFCDSDKYAFMLQFTQMPSDMRAKMLSGMTAQMMEAMQHTGLEDSLFDNEPSRRDIISSTIKNIYRFFKLHPVRNDYYAPFEKLPEREISLMLTPGHQEQLEVICDVLYDANRYGDVVTVYQMMIHADELPPERLRKIAIAHDMVQRHAAAAELYRQYLEANPGQRSVWLRLATCLSALGNYQGAIDALEPHAEAATDDVEFLSVLAGLYAAAGRWANAMDIYYNIDYILPDGDHSARTDLAWALAMNAETDTARTMLEGADNDAPTLRRRAAIEWIAGHHSLALDLLESAMSEDPDGAAEDALYSSGLEYLREHVAGADTLPMMPQILAYRRSGSQFGKI